MKKCINFLLSLFIISVLYSCSDDSSTNSPGGSVLNSTNLSGKWSVDKVQLVQAPSGNSISAIMKQTLQPLGEVNSSFVGNMDFTFGAEILSSSNLNINLSSSNELFFYENTGYRLTYSNGLSKSTDGGITWINITLPVTSNGSNQLFVYNQSSLYLINSSSQNNIKLFKSNNSGVNWETVNINMGFVPINYGINTSFCFVNQFTGFALSNNFNIFKTTNGGLNWSSVYSWGSFNYYAKMIFFDEMNGVILDQNILKKSTNGGLNWIVYWFAGKWNFPFLI